MNCIRCPILQECKVKKRTTRTVVVEGEDIPTEMVALNKSECPLLKKAESK